MRNDEGGTSSTLPKAHAYALRLLKFRPRSEAELKERLLRKGFGTPTVESFIEEFKRKGLIDDAKFAQYLVTSRMLHKPKGKRALLLELKSKGVKGIQAAEAVKKAFGGEDELTLAKELAVKRLGALRGLPSLTVQRRLFGYLSRRGFSSETVYQVLRQLREGQATFPGTQPHKKSSLSPFSDDE